MSVEPQAAYARCVLWLISMVETISCIFAWSAQRCLPLLEHGLEIRGYLGTPSELPAGPCISSCGTIYIYSRRVLACGAQQDLLSRLDDKSYRSRGPNVSIVAPFFVTLRKVWDYSINQATLETIFMSFAKDQEEETASVPGVSYADTPNRDVANRNIPTQETRFDGRDRRPAASMDVEMAWLGNGGNREGSENDGPGADGEISALL